MLPLLLALSAHAAPATPFVGVAWRPLSRADLVWVDEGRTSGTAVGEFDGAVRPLLDAFAGVWFNRYIGLQAGIGVARATSTSRVGEGYRQRHQGVVRPSFDLRFGWMEPAVRRPTPWFLLGVYGNIPSARDVSDAYTPDEQAAADATAATERARLGGVGGRVGAGVDYRVLPGLSIGALLTVGVHRAAYTGGDERFTTIWVATEAAFLLTFEWPPKPGGRRGAAGDGSLPPSADGAAAMNAGPAAGPPAERATGSGAEGAPSTADVGG
jgi:hypothetical protein